MGMLRLNFFKHPEGFEFWQTVFKRVGGQSAVYHQPESQEERFTALQALLACPTASIHTESPPKEMKSVHASFPQPIDPQNLEVYLTAYLEILHRQENLL
jgi:hypothetical protein